MIRELLVSAAVVVAYPDSSHAQYCVSSDSASREARGARIPKEVHNPDSVYSLAAKLAPTLRFGPGEAYFPTIPFFRAFDTKENASGSWTADVLDTIAGLAPDGSVSWNTLDSTYALRQTSQNPTEEQVDSVPIPTTTAVFFQTRCLGAGGSALVWEFLQNDAQAWMRSRTLQDLYLKWHLYKAVFQVFEYYFYYVNDTGLQGHPNDLESVFVFLPRLRDDSAQTNPEAMKGLDDLLIIVGQGHSASTPNNVLVLTGHEARYVRQRGWHAMVELGGHSSAADRNQDGEFSPGFDANWNIHENMWGTRDLQAIAGAGYLGDYESWMTLPRSYRYSVTIGNDPDNLRRLLELSPGKTGLDVAAADSFAKRTQEDRDRTLTEETERSGKPVNAGDLARARTQRGYLLIPVRVLHRLYWALEAVPDTGRAIPDSIRTTIVSLVNDSLAGLLQPWGFKGFAPDLSPDDTDAIIRRMVLWTKPPTFLQGKNHKELPIERILVWKNRASRSPPHKILKAELFRPSATLPREYGTPARSSIKEFGYWMWDLELSAGGAQGIGGGILHPDFLPLRLFTRSLGIPGIFEYKGGFYIPGFSPDRIRPGISVTYDRHYKSFLSWFLTYSWVIHRGHLERGATNSALIVGGTVMPFFPLADTKWAGSFATHVRVRPGMRLEIRSSRPLVRRLTLEVSYYVR